MTGTVRLFMQTLLGFMLTLLAPAAHAMPNWNDLWTTADQRGAQLMKRGDMRAAASAFADPRHKAYAELEAGQYTEAARDFAKFDDSDAHYNRGNALAHAGNLDGAIKAYDEALTRDPHNKDALHNRDLVKQALRQKQIQPQSSADNKNKSDKKDDSGKSNQQGKDSSQENGNGKQDGKGPQASKGAQQNQSANSAQSRGDSQNQPGKSGQGQEDKNTKSQQQSQASMQKAGANGANQPAQDQRGSGKTQADSSIQSSAKTGNNQSEDDKAQAARDVQAGSEAVSGNKPATNASAGSIMGQQTSGQAAANKLTDEHKLAQEQWLRQIPDDPGGLLRRKLLIEHLIRQQRAQQ